VISDGHQNWRRNLSLRYIHYIICPRLIYNIFARERRRHAGEDWSEKSQTIANVASLSLLPRASHEHLTIKILHIDRLKRGRETVEDRFRSPDESRTCAHISVNARKFAPPRISAGMFWRRSSLRRDIALVDIHVHAHMYVHRYPRRSTWVVRIDRQDRLF